MNIEKVSIIGLGALGILFGNHLAKRMNPDAVKIGNTLQYTNMGMICFGDLIPGEISEKTKTVASFFEKMELPYLVDTDMQRRLWGKFMLNVGINQSVAVFDNNYGGVQKDGKARDIMIQAMREVVRISAAARTNPHTAKCLNRYSKRQGCGAPDRRWHSR